MLVSVFNSQDPVVRRNIFGIARFDLTKRTFEFTPVGPSTTGMMGLHVTPDRKKTYCIYDGPNEDAIRQAAERNGLPVDGGPAKKVGKQHDWNELEILAQGNRVRVAVNGKQVVDWRDPEPDRIKEGPIGLQLHSLDMPQEMRFKGLVLTTHPEDKLITVK